MSAKSYSMLAACLFTLMALAQLGRAVTRMHIMAGEMPIPLTVSWVAFAVLALLAVLGFRAASR